MSTARSRRSSSGRSDASCPRRPARSSRGSPAATRSSPASAADGSDGRRMVGVQGVRYVGSHGLELEPEAEAWRGGSGFVGGVAWPVEDKGLTVSMHYRKAVDQEAAPTLEAIAGVRAQAGLDARFGRKVLELRPPVRRTRERPCATCSPSAGSPRSLRG